MKKIELESLGHDDLWREWQSLQPTEAGLDDLDFYEWLKSIWSDLLGVRIEPKYDFENEQDQGMPWAYCYFMEKESDRTWFLLGGK